MEKINREWSIETGLIERIYSHPRGVTETLIEKGLEAAVLRHQGRVSPEEADRAIAMMLDHHKVLEGLFAFVKRELPLTEHYIRSLHAEHTAHQRETDACRSARTPCACPVDPRYNGLKTAVQPSLVMRTCG
jgi:hypothetical protein